jgi:hypothetical protein
MSLGEKGLLGLPQDGFRVHWYKVRMLQRDGPLMDRGKNGFQKKIGIPNHKETKN